MIDINSTTPIEKRGSIWFKRDDLFNIDGFSGAKVRACYAMCQEAVNSGYNSVVSSGFRYSPQLAIVGMVANKLGLKSVGFTSKGEVTPFLMQASKYGLEVRQVPCGYSGVLKSEMRKYAEENNSFIIPQAMESDLAISLVKQQLLNSFSQCSELYDVKRIVTAVGSGTNLSGILEGLKELDISIPVLAIIVGHDCGRAINNRFSGGKILKQLSFITSPVKYLDNSIYNKINGVIVDSRYEGKAIPYLKAGDLFWLVGLFNTVLVSVSRDIN